MDVAINELGKTFRKIVMECPFSFPFRENKIIAYVTWYSDPFAGLNDRESVDNELSCINRISNWKLAMLQYIQPKTNPRPSQIPIRLVSYSNLH